MEDYKPTTKERAEDLLDKLIQSASLVEYRINNRLPVPKMCEDIQSLQLYFNMCHTNFIDILEKEYKLTNDPSHDLETIHNFIKDIKVHGFHRLTMHKAHLS